MEEYLIVDDIAAALARLSAQGRTIVGPAVELVRDAVIAQARRSGWTIVKHEGFVEWARRILDYDSARWVVLDALFPIHATDHHIYRMRLSRWVDSASHIVERRLQASSLPAEPGSVGLLDDAAQSGRTIVQTARMLSERKQVTRRAVVLASSSLGRARAAASLPGIRWDEYVPGNWHIIHLRDACPYLPFSGRPRGVAKVGTKERDLELRSMLAAEPGHLWQIICMTPTIGQAVSWAADEIVRRLSVELGREALVEDLLLLGDEVTVTCTAGVSLGANSPLRHTANPNTAAKPAVHVGAEAP